VYSRPSSGHAHPGRQAILGEPRFVDELAIGIGGLDQVEILSLEVLDRGELELIAIGELAHEPGCGRDPRPAPLGRRSPATS
jgi:hypothetical protein